MSSGSTFLAPFDSLQDFPAIAVHASAHQCDHSPKCAKAADNSRQRLRKMAEAAAAELIRKRTAEAFCLLGHQWKSDRFYERPFGPDSNESTNSVR
jgi:hypothetical protein